MEQAADEAVTRLFDKLEAASLERNHAKIEAATRDILRLVVTDWRVMVNHLGSIANSLAIISNKA